MNILNLDCCLSSINSKREDWLQVFVQRIAYYRQQAKTRHQLASLTERQRRDVGLSLEQVEEESAKPFWK